jgi:mRNA interferase RelE/StbE
VTGRYELGTAPPARRALAELLPHDVAVAAIEFITGPMLANPQRMGRPLGEELSGIYGAPLAREWRVLYEIDEVPRRCSPRYPASFGCLSPTLIDDRVGGLSHRGCNGELLLPRRSPAPVPDFAD